MSPFALLKEKEHTYQQVLRGKKKLLKSFEMLPVQVLTKEEMTELDNPIWDRNNELLQVAYAKDLINKDRRVIMCDWMLDNFAEVVEDGRKIKGFIESMDRYTEHKGLYTIKGNNLIDFMENILYIHVAGVLAQYNADKQYKEIKGHQSIFIVNCIASTGTRAIETIISLYSMEFNIHYKTARDKVKSCLLRLDKKGIVYIKKAEKNNNDIYALCKNVMKIENKWFKKENA